MHRANHFYHSLQNVCADLAKDYALDARLLNDSVRVLTRLMQLSLELVPGPAFAFAKRTRRAKKRCYQIVMAKSPKAAQRRQRCYKD